MATKLQPVPAISAPIADDRRFCTHLWYNWFLQLKIRFDSSLGTGYSGVIVTAKLTALGTQGSMTFVNGILTTQVAAT